MGTDHGNNLYPRFATGNVEGQSAVVSLRPHSNELSTSKGSTTEA
jgi:hypothetical protein